MNTKTLPLLLIIAGLPLITTAAPVVIDTVPIRDAGNATDTTGFGKVLYDYRIGRFEITIGQYVEFLNAVAATDTHGLYSIGMASSAPVAGVSRSGTAGSYVYAAIGNPDRPITFVSWFDAARFANWMSNGQPVGLQTATTTEDGAYTLVPPFDHVGFTKNALNPNTDRPPVWWIPSEHEWYKAAYYNPTRSGGAGGYHFYPIQSPIDNVPYSAADGGSTAPDPSLSGNFRRDDGIANGYNDGYAITGSAVFPTSNALAKVGSYGLAPTFYGTYDQGGNVLEITDGILDSGGVLFRASRGGSWFDDESIMRSTYRLNLNPDTEAIGIGFRLASIDPSDQRIRLATPRRSQLRVGNRFNLAVSTTSGLPVTVTSSDRRLFSIRGLSAKVKRSGRFTLTATQAGDAFFLPATTVSRRVRIR
jgi:formylglycine-generating enzyme required for sulfatase activity